MAASTSAVGTRPSRSTVTPSGVHATTVDGAPRHGPPSRTSATASPSSSATASGDLTLHGVTRPVDVPVEARWSGTTIEVVGTIPVNFADYDIEAPSVGGFVSVEDEGEIELQLTFVPA